jgi:solute carrier family 6 (neurotransmitter transporter, amino acid/orphan) member 15/16/17/18/20
MCCKWFFLFQKVRVFLLKFVFFFAQQSSPTQYYWYRTTLMSSPSVDEPENFNYSVAIALISAWIIIYVCMVQGITSSGKIVYITALFPYVVLIIFFFRGITLKGK